MVISFPLVNMLSFFGSFHQPQIKSDIDSVTLLLSYCLRAQNSIFHIESYARPPLYSIGRNMRNFICICSSKFHIFKHWFRRSSIKKNQIPFTNRAKGKIKSPTSEVSFYVCSIFASQKASAEDGVQMLRSSSRD
ncbi:unnamed protein product [Citrullus colocynthis]|uniref:Uncharacterized protein n=1 Tax=Citrullus colocynthis TaxID=252529 RepID=A0ABP0XZ27_9ROSI